MVGVHVELSPGWKTYWRAPGASGIPPQFDWTGSENVAEAHVHWPTPDVFENFGIRSIGYHDELLVPVEIEPVDAERPISLELSLFYGICEEVCIPAQSADSLAADAAATEGSRQAIMDALENGALTAAEAGVSDLVCTMSDGAPQTLAARIEFISPPEALFDVIFETGDEALAITPLNAALEGDALMVNSAVSYYGSGDFELDPERLRLTLLGGARAVDLVGCTMPSG